MAKKTYYYKFLIRLDYKLNQNDIDSIKKAIQRANIDLTIMDIKGGVANNSGYHKFGDEKKD